MTQRIAQLESEPLASRVVLWFAFLGPIGNLIPVPGVPASFRTYYLFLLPGIAFYLCRGVRRRTIHHFLILTPLLLYMFISAVFAYFAYSDNLSGAEENPLFRFCLFVALLLFTMCAGEEAAGFSPHQKLRVLAFFMSGYVVSLVVGYIFFIGFYAHVISFDFISRFEIIVQWGFGLLRFSPGSYPNEYGVVSSFALAVITMFVLYRRRLLDSDPLFRRLSSIPLLILLFLLTLGALFLATTRAAYISYLLSLLYIAFSLGGLLKPLKFIGATVGIGTLLLLCVQPFFDVIGIIQGGYDAFFSERGFGSGRFDNWDMALGYYLQKPYLGFGFGTMDMIHNVYLQMIFGLGVAGTTLLALTIIVIVVRALRARGVTPTAGDADQTMIFLQKVTVVAAIHVLWFALSNHNLNHFLTWFTVLLLYQCGSPDHDYRADAGSFRPLGHLVR